MFAAAALIAALPAVVQADTVEEIVRDASRLESVKTVAVLPPVIEVRFDRPKTLPDPDRLAARALVAKSLSLTLPVQIASGTRFHVAPDTDLILALARTHAEPLDLFRAVVRGSLDSPAETIVNRSGDTVELLATAADVAAEHGAATRFRFRWRNRGDTLAGLAAFEKGADSDPDPAAVKSLSRYLDADALLCCLVSDMDVRQGGSSSPLGYALGGGPFSSTRIHLTLFLVSLKDGTIVWQARAQGVSSSKEGLSARSNHGRDAQQAFVGAGQAVNALLDDLYSGPPDRR
jgi:hypothetical protein